MVPVIDLTRLRHVILVAREGSFARAAQAANLSQPALSRSIQSIERQFRIRLFDRSSAGVVLTDAGQSFLGLAESFVWRAESLESELQMISSGVSGAVNLGVGPLAATLLLGDLAELVFAKDMRASVRIDQDASLRRLLLDGEIEFFIGGSWGRATDFVVSSRLRKDFIGVSRFVLMVRWDHPLATADSPSPEELSRYPLIGGSIMRSILDETLSAEFGLQHPSLEVDDYPVLVDIARRSDAVLLASPYLRSTPLGQGLRVLAVDLPTDRVNIPAVVVRLGDRTLSPAAEQLAHRLASHLRRIFDDYDASVD